MLGDGTRDDILGGDVLGNGDILGDGIRGVLRGGSSVFEVIPTSGGGKYLSKRV